MNKLYLLFGLLLFFPLVSANLVINSTSNLNPTYIGESKIFYLTLLNNGSFEMKNLNMTPINKYTFPVIGNLLPGEIKTVPYSVLNNEISSGVYVSTFSFFFDSIYNVTPKEYSLNISDSGFSNCNLTIMQNDSVLWFNGRSVNSEIKSLTNNWII